MDIQRKSLGRVMLRIKIKRTIWNIVSFFLFRFFPTKIFRPWRILLLKLFGAKLKWDSEVYASAKIWAPWRLQMGHCACLGPDVICYNQDWIVLKDNAVVSQYSYLCTASHDIEKTNTVKDSLITAPIILEKESWVGSRAFIGLGVRIGENAVVGATASVFKDVEPWTVVGGNPAKFLKNRVMRNE